jgi:hypothetical protein
MLTTNINYENMLNLLHIKVNKIHLVNIHTITLVFWDMLFLLKVWRHIKGYPANGQSTHTNSKNSKKNKTLLNFRLQQFYSLFGKKRRNIFPTLIQAEYNNRLWFYMWRWEWLQGEQFLFSLVNQKKLNIPFDPVSLAKGQTNGYIRIGKAAKVGKAKKITKQGTIGAPLFFTKLIYAEYLPESFPYRLTIGDDLRRKMGKKKKKNKKHC